MKADHQSNFMEHLTPLGSFAFRFPISLSGPDEKKAITESCEMT
jgi:hypothetical protein